MYRKLETKSLPASESSINIDLISNSVRKHVLERTHLALVHTYSAAAAKSPWSTLGLDHASSYNCTTKAVLGSETTSWDREGQGTLGLLWPRLGKDRPPLQSQLVLSTPRYHTIHSLFCRIAATRSLRCRAPSRRAPAVASPGVAVRIR